MFLPYPRAASVGSFRRPTAAAPAALANEVTVTTTINGGTFGFLSVGGGAAKNFAVATTTGYAKIEYWDSTSVIVGTGITMGYGPFLQAVKSVVSPYNNTSSKTCKIYSCNSLGTKSGSIRGINIINSQTSTSGGNTYNNKITSIDIAGCTTIDNNDINISATDITSLTLPNAPNSFAGIFVNGNPSLTTIDITGLPNSNYCFLKGNSLSAISLNQFGAWIASYGKSYSALRYTFDIRDNNLSASALNNVYSGLTTGSQNSFYPAVLMVSGNPGTSSDDPTIATNKNWTVYGT